MKTVATFTKPEEAYLAKARLEAEGLAPEIRDEMTAGTYWLIGNAIGGVRLDVPDEQADAARAILGLPPQKKGLLVCPRCGSHDVHVRDIGTVDALCVAFGFVLPGDGHTADCRDCGHAFKIDAHGRPMA